MYILMFMMCEMERLYMMIVEMMR